MPAHFYYATVCRQCHYTICSILLKIKQNIPPGVRTRPDRQDVFCVWGAPPAVQHGLRVHRLQQSCGSLPSMRVILPSFRSLAQLEIPLDDGKSHRAGFFGVELGADDVAAGHRSADMAAAVNRVGQTVGVVGGLCLVGVDEIAFIPRLDAGQDAAGKVAASAGGEQAPPSRCGAPSGGCRRLPGRGCAPPGRG